MRHATVCACRDCGVANLSAIMEGIPDEEGKLVVAVAAIRLGRESLQVDSVALPYAEILATAQQLEGELIRLTELVRRLPDPYCGPAMDLIEEIEGQLRTLRDSWRRP